MKLIATFILLFFSFIAEANTLALVHFDKDYIKSIHCEPFESMGMHFSYTQSHDTLWLDLGHFDHDVYPYYFGQMSFTAQNWYMVVGPDTTVLDLLGKGSGPEFYGQRAMENNILYTMYYKTGMFPCDANAGLESIAKPHGNRLVFDIDLDGKKRQCSQYVKTLQNLPLAQQRPEYVQQWTTMAKLALTTRLGYLYHLLNNHKYADPQAADPEEKSVDLFIDSAAVHMIYPEFYVPFIITYTNSLNEYKILKMLYTQSGGKTYSLFVPAETSEPVKDIPIKYFEGFILPGVVEAAYYPEPNRSILLYYYLKKTYESKYSRTHDYPQLLDKVKVLYPDVFENKKMAAFYNSYLAQAQATHTGKSLDGSLLLLDDHLQKVSLKSLTANDKGIFMIAWASWCGRCGDAIHLYNELRKKYSNEINFVSFSIDDNTDNWREGLKKKQVSGTAYIDTGFNNSFNSKMNIDHVPQIIVLDKDLQIKSYGEMESIGFYEKLLQQL
ncbi:TlpA family protein disulfide reductase [Chitinophagaceae bacterium MMS25-I14]